ncbi:MAG: FAD-dependent oxidoreductase [Candidatus Omnitrophica bacterium]|nr:FAD-dependent oxidoreductase [Candidatus Omnitrophota bacterium]
MSTETHSLIHRAQDSLPGGKIIIIGAGLSGIATAFFLRGSGITAPVYEKEKNIGGLCRSTHINGYTFDYCGHLLHFRRPEVFTLLHSLMGKDLTRHRRDASVSIFNTHIRYPFQANLHGLPPQVRAACLEGFIQAKKRIPSDHPENFAQWSHCHFGRAITEYFMKPYNEKFWTVSLEELSCEWVNDFIVVPTLRQVRARIQREEKRRLGYHSFFWYPSSGGIEQLIKSFTRGNQSMHTEHEVVRIDPVTRRIWFSHGSSQQYDRLVSTMPLPLLANVIAGLPDTVRDDFKKLRWTSIYNINLGLAQPVNFDHHWMYFPEHAHSFFRVGCFDRFSPSLVPPGKRSLYVEVSYSKGKPLDKKIEKQAIDDLMKAKIISSPHAIETIHVNDIPFAYPLYDFEWKTARSNILKYLHAYHIFPVGRFGGWQYMSMEDVILEAERTAALLAHR